MIIDTEATILAHIKAVNALLLEFAQAFLRRAAVHDESKLTDQLERETFSRFTPLLGVLESGSPAYLNILEQMGPGLQHHYQVNDHHPEHYSEGVEGMDAFALLEMLADWRAASSEKDISFFNVLEVNIPRFQISPPLAQLIIATARSLYWIDKEDAGILTERYGWQKALKDDTQ